MQDIMMRDCVRRLAVISKHHHASIQAFRRVDVDDAINKQTDHRSHTNLPVVNEVAI